MFRDCLLKRLFGRRSRKTSKLRITGLCAGNSPVNSPHKSPVTRKMFPFGDVIMCDKWVNRSRGVSQRPPTSLYVHQSKSGSTRGHWYISREAFMCSNVIMCHGWGLAPIVAIHIDDLLLFYITLYSSVGIHKKFHELYNILQTASITIKFFKSNGPLYPVLT